MIAMEIKVSVIVAMYNSAKFLEKCVSSLVNQTLSGVEVILVNDCSPDNSLELAQQFKKEYPELIKIVNHEVNLRAGAARNNGLSVSTGKYVWFVDADDWLDPTALEKAYYTAEKNHSDVVSVDYYEIASESDEPSVLQEGVSDTCCGLMDKKKRNEYIVTCKGGFSKLIRREFLINNGLYYPEGILFEDNGIVPLIGAVAIRVDTIHEGLYYYRVGNANSQTNVVRSDAVMNDRMKAMDYFLEKIRELDMEKELHDGAEYFFVFIYFASIVRFYIRGNCNISYKTFRKMKKTTHKEFPKYRKNEYIKTIFPRTTKIALIAAEIGWIPVKLLRGIFHLKQTIRR